MPTKGQVIIMLRDRLTDETTTHFRCGFIDVALGIGLEKARAMRGPVVDWRSG